MSPYKYAYKVGERYILSVPVDMETHVLPRGTLLKVEDHDELTGYVRFVMPSGGFLELLATDDVLRASISSLPPPCQLCNTITGVFELHSEL